jgi:hypothetical protein
MRFGQLVVSKGSQGLDISHLRFRFEVKASDVETPNTMMVRVYNLKEETVNTIIQEFDTVTLTAGYVNGNKGNIFQGDIKQFRHGRERNVDSYLDIMAGDGDQAYNFGIVNTTMPAGTLGAQELSTYAARMNLPVAQTAEGFLQTGGILPRPRGKVAWGMARAYLRDLAHDAGARWSIQDGVVTLIPNTGYLPGQAVAINTASGMIGTPEQTDQGITVRCYLNPLIKVGRLVKINNRDINQAVVKSQFFPSYTSQYYPATTSDDGLYRVLVAEHTGDSRGNDWFTELTCLVVDPTSPVQTSVQGNG